MAIHNTKPKRRLLVTGAGGFLGWNICSLAAQTWDVIGTTFSNKQRIHEVNVVTAESETNYHPSDQVASFEMPAEEVNEIYYPPTLAEAWLDSYRFIDPNPTGQVFPGFEASPPDS